MSMLSLQSKEPLSLTVFWLISLHFYLNEVRCQPPPRLTSTLTNVMVWCLLYQCHSPAEKLLFLSTFSGSSIPEFRELGAVCLQLTNPEELSPEDEFEDDCDDFSVDPGV